MGLARFLDEIEVPMLGRGPAQIVEYEGVLDRSVLARAFDLLAVLHPVLTGRIGRKDGQYHLVAAPEQRPLFTLRRAGDGEFSQLIRRMSTPDTALAELVLVEGDARGFISLRVDHSMADNAVTEVLLEDLWRLYTEVAAGRDPVLEEGELPLSPVALMKERAGVVPPDIVFEERDRVAVQLARELSEHDTAVIISAARRHGTSVHALVCGAILTSLRDKAGHAKPSEMACLSVVNLRERLTPPVTKPAGTTNLLVSHRAEVRVPLKGDIVAVGREVKEQLDSAVADLAGGGLFETDPTAPVAAPGPQHLAKALITNAGQLRPYLRPAGLALPRRRMVFSPTTLTYPWHAVFSHEGKLNLVARYPADVFSQDEVESVVGTVLERLSTVV